MAHFKLVYEGHPLTLPLEQPSIKLRATVEHFPGQTLDDEVSLFLNAGSPKYLFSPSGNPDDEDALWLNPFLDTQWLKLPLKRFQDRDFRSLDGLKVTYLGEGTHNDLTEEDDWWEAPGLVATYSDELFKQAEIMLRHEGGGRFAVTVTGRTELDTEFDIAFSAPLSVELVAYNNKVTSDVLLTWFDTFLRKDDFSFNAEQRGGNLYLTGTVKP